jgi:hypothetical protein
LCSTAPVKKPSSVLDRVLRKSRRKTSSARAPASRPIFSYDRSTSRRPSLM